LKERDDDDDEHFVDVIDDDDEASSAADAAAAAADTDRANDTDMLSTKSSWVHRNNLTCVLYFSRDYFLFNRAQTCY